MFEILHQKQSFCAATELCCLPERKWMYHISCWWTRISKCLPYLGTPHGSRDREVVSFSSFPQPEQIDSEQYQITSFSETFSTPKVQRQRDENFFVSPLRIFCVEDIPSTSKKHLYMAGIFNKKEMHQEGLNGHKFFRILIQGKRMVKYSSLFLGCFEELARPDSVTVNFSLSTPHSEI